MRRGWVCLLSCLWNVSYLQLNLLRLFLSSLLVVVLWQDRRKGRCGQLFFICPTSGSSVTDPATWQRPAIGIVPHIFYQPALCSLDWGQPAHCLYGATAAAENIPWFIIAWPAAAIWLPSLAANKTEPVLTEKTVGVKSNKTRPVV